MRRIDPLHQDLPPDPFEFLGPNRKKRLETGWPALFRRTILEEIPITEIQQGFHERMGRLTKKLRTQPAVLIPQQMFVLTDDETVRQLVFHLEWHYALGWFQEDDATKYLCERTLYLCERTLRVYRARVTDQQLDTMLFRILTNALLAKRKIPAQKQRLDSTYLRLDMRRGLKQPGYRLVSMLESSGARAKPRVKIRFIHKPVRPADPRIRNRKDTRNSLNDFFTGAS